MAQPRPVQHLAKHKVVFLGDMSVGKSSIINRFMYGTFDTVHQPTIGIDFLSKTLNVDSRTIRLQIWDTAGQERFRSLIPSYIRDCSAAVVVYDVTSRVSFRGVEKWLQDIKDERGGGVVVMLAGNKVDISDKREVTAEEAAEKAQQAGVRHIEVSAKSGLKIKDLFLELARELPGMKVAEEPKPETLNLAVATQESRVKDNKCTC